MGICYFYSHCLEHSWKFRFRLQNCDYMTKSHGIAAFIWILAAILKKVAILERYQIGLYHISKGTPQANFVQNLVLLTKFEQSIHILTENGWTKPTKYKCMLLFFSSALCYCTAVEQSYCHHACARRPSVVRKTRFLRTRQAYLCQIWWEGTFSPYLHTILLLLLLLFSKFCIFYF